MCMSAERNDRVRWPSATEAQVLRLLVSHGPSYGLELVKASDGNLKRGTVYVLLDRMEDKGLIESREETEPPTDGYVGIPRRVYRAKGAGVRVLEAMERDELLLKGAVTT
jgi:DNA-binding PadR family transcriptional regulator